MERRGKGEGELDDTIAASSSTPKPPGSAGDLDTLNETHVPDSRPPPVADSWPTLTGSASSASPVTRYRIEGVIGRGGMGEVMSARDEQIGRSVAIKRMRGDDPPPSAVARFLREARIQGRLDHPAVVPVHELWHDQRNPCFVMKQLAGTPLSDVLDKIASEDLEARKQFTLQRLLRAFAEVCLAVEFAHTRGVVHRDLKPANIMLGDFGEVYVLDWGIARVAGDVASRASFADIETLDGGGGTVAGAILGTPGYMSPEQVSGDAEIDGRSDVYALGSMLFEILALQPLHERGRPALQTTLLGVEARPSVRAPDRDTPPELDTICIAATMLDRDDRYATARELGDAVQRFLDGDRDVALRKQIASTELAAAHAALERGNGVVERRDAIRAAARALALDPSNPEPADLVGRLMLQPPAEVPREVEDTIETLDLDALYAARKLIVAGALSLLAFLPIMYWAGFRAPWFLITSSVLAGFMGVCAWLATRRSIVIAARISLVCSALSITMFALVTTPFLFAPCIAVVFITMITTHPKVARPWILVGVFTAAVLVPWGLEASGIIPSTMAVSGTTLVLSTRGADTLDPLVITFGFVLYVVFMTLISAVLMSALTGERRAAQRVVQIQAWQLRQLMPRAAAG